MTKEEASGTLIKMDLIREQIENILQSACLNGWDEYARTKKWRDGMLSYDDVADAILSIPGIRIEAEDQSLPENPYLAQIKVYEVDECEAGRIGYAEAQQDMLGAGFVRCEPKEK